MLLSRAQADTASGWERCWVRHSAPGHREGRPGSRDQLRTMCHASGTTQQPKSRANERGRTPTLYFSGGSSHRTPPALQACYIDSGRRHGKTTTLQGGAAAAGSDARLQLQFGGRCGDRAAAVPAVSASWSGLSAAAGAVIGLGRVLEIFSRRSSLLPCTPVGPPFRHPGHMPAAMPLPPTRMAGRRAADAVAAAAPLPAHSPCRRPPCLQG